MVKCPECKKEVAKPSKKWKYAIYTVELLECGCGTKFRQYLRNGKCSFALKFQKGKEKSFVKS